jgi:cobalt transporter subunit CbtA
MSLFRLLVVNALIAGCLVGSVASMLHLTTTVPIILAAEIYENAGGHHDAMTGGPAHDEPSETSSGRTSLISSRNTLTVVAMILAYVGFALLLNAFAETFGILNDWRQGVAWGLAGFLIFSLVPAMGLPPELPGMPAADLLSRQVWWAGSALSTSGAVAAWYLVRDKSRWLVALALILLPFAIGAPHPESEITAVPPALHAQFIIFTLIISLLSWQMLGATLGWLRSKKFAV